MNSEIKICQNCKQKFTIEPEDFDFYKKIDVPPPTFCPQCRMMRRFTWRNERIFHKNKCAKTGKPIISGFAPDSGYVVYNRDLWWSDEWDAMEYGVTYDFSRPFFIQFNELMHRTPMPAVFNARTVNCDYSNYTGEYKNGYLVSASWEGENIAYSARCNKSKDCMDMFAVVGCELSYEDVFAIKCYRTHYSQNVENCNDSMFLFECKGCQNCIGCVNLRNKSYYIFNQPYSREEYLSKVKELKLNTSEGIKAMAQKFGKLKFQALRKYANIINSQEVTGDSIVDSFNCKECFDIAGDLKDCKFVQNALVLKDSYDGYGVGAPAELLYEMFDSGIQGSRQCFGGTIYGGTNIFYSYNCHGCNNLFGCVGLRNKEYCIFNKQYDKDSFRELRGKIIAHMDEMPYISKKANGQEQIVYKYGEFFPTELSPFGYNETVAQEQFPLTIEKAKESGYLWRETPSRNYKITKNPDQLPEIGDADNSVLDEIIGCPHGGECNEGCTTAFRMTQEELNFHKKLDLPLPVMCPNCRHYARLKQRNPLKLWHRQCQCAGQKSENGIYSNISSHQHGISHCLNEFETPFAPERPEIVYCEQCYNTEVA